MSTTDLKPTAEMVAFYDKRTNAHIERVRHCLHLMAEVTNFKDELLIRAQGHDASKFGPDEYIPYIWLTEYYRRRQLGELFEYPEGIKAQVRKAIQHHVTTNRHHAEFHADPNDMTDIDLIEMVCDWTAMAQENNEPNESARSWADKTIGTRLHLNDERRSFVYSMIELLDQNLKSG
ncbi:MAG: DUF5662 family protein [Anaerolineae bacterium]